MEIKNSFGGLPSSPLKNINPESENVDDRTSDVLNRYGSDFENVSKRRTPLMSKTRSDITSSSSNHKKQNQRNIPTSTSKIWGCTQSQINFRVYYRLLSKHFE